MYGLRTHGEHEENDAHAGPKIDAMLARCMLAVECAVASERLSYRVRPSRDSRNSDASARGKKQSC